MTDPHTPLSASPATGNDESAPSVAVAPPDSTTPPAHPAGQGSASGIPERALTSPLPLYQQLKQWIVERIDSGDWPAHHRLPSEAELVAHFGASRMTVHRALRELTAEGMLVRMQGVGTFVAERKGRSALFAINSIADEVRGRGHRYSSRVVLMAEEAATTEQAIALRIQEGQPIFHSIIVHHANGIPVQLEDRYVNAQVIPHYLEQDFSEDPPYSYLIAHAPLTEGEHIVEAILAQPHECELLAIAPTEPCLLIRRRTWSGSVNVSYARLLHPGSRHHLQGHFSA